MSALENVEEDYGVDVYQDKTEMKGTCLDFVSDRAYNEIMLMPAGREHFIESLKSEGVEVIEPKKNQLFLDIDTDADYFEFLSRIRVVMVMTDRELSHRLIQSRTKKHLHIIVEWDEDISDELRIALQMALNSDPMREFLSLIRLIRKDVYPNVLFNRTGANYGN